MPSNRFVLQRQIDVLTKQSTHGRLYAVYHNGVSLSRARRGLVILKHTKTTNSPRVVAVMSSEVQHRPGDGQYGLSPREC